MRVSAKLDRRTLIAGLAAAPAVARAAPPAPLGFHFGPGPTPGGHLVASGPYSDSRGYGFEPASIPTDRLFSVKLAEGNHRVTVTLGEGITTVKAESRRLMLEQVAVGRRPVTRSFVVNVRDDRLTPPEPNAPGGARVRLNEREQGSYSWDDKLTLEFLGPADGVRSVVIEAADVPTIYLAGDSTVTDQRFEPAASWGQMLPRFLSDKAAVANHAESGETLKSFLAELRLDKLLSRMRPGDWLLIQFGHNDSKAQWPQTYAPAETTYRDYLRAYIGEARRRGANPVLVTPVQRRRFDARGRIVNTHGAYPEAVKAVGAETSTPVVDLTAMSARFYEALGPQRAPLAFNDGGRDATHHDNYGAYVLARCVVQGLRELNLFPPDWWAADVGPFDPSKPPPPETFALPASGARSSLIPRGG